MIKGSAALRKLAFISQFLADAATDPAFSVMGDRLPFFTFKETTNYSHLKLYCALSDVPRKLLHCLNNPYFFALLDYVRHPS